MTDKYQCVKLAVIFFTGVLIVGSIFPLVAGNVDGDGEKPIWPMFRRDLKNTGRNEDAEMEPSDDITWTFDTEGWIDSSPVVGSDGTIYIANREGELYALSEDGEKRWSYNTTSDIFSTPAVSSEGYIYLGTREGELYSFYENGTKRWMVDEPFEEEIRMSPKIREDGTILVGSRRMYSFYPNGTIQWEYTHTYNEGEFYGSIYSSPAVCEEGNIYFGFTVFFIPGSNVGQLISLDSEGNKRWNYTVGGYESPDFGGDVRASPAIGEDGTIYFASYNYRVYALDEEGNEMWRFGTGGQIFSSPAVGDDGTIYIGSGDDHLYAISPEGREKWAFKTGFLFELSRDDHAQYLEEGNVSTELIEAFEEKGHELNIDANLTKEEENIWGVEGEDYEIKMGEETLDIYGAGDEIHSSPAIGPEGNIYFGSSDENVYSLYPNGTRRWTVETEHSILSSPAIDSSGLLYIGSYDEAIYAIGSEPEREDLHAERLLIPMILAIILLVFVFFPKKHAEFNGGQNRDIKK